MANSPEYMTFVQCGSELRDAFKDDLDALSTDLYAAGLISSDNVDAARNSGVSVAVRAGDLMGVVRNRVKLDTSNYTNFIQVLTKRQNDHKPILKILDQKYRSLGGRGSSSTVSSQQMQETTTCGDSPGLAFSFSMSDGEFVTFIKSKGVSDMDASKVTGNGITPKIFVDLTDEEINDPSLNFSFGGKMAIKKILREIRSAGTGANQKGSQPATKRTIESDGNGSHLTIMQLGAVYSEVKDARAKWYFIGLALGINPDDLDSIRIKCRENPEECLTETLKLFLKEKDPKATWARLADALEDSSVGEGYLADELRQKF